MNYITPTELEVIKNRHATGLSTLNDGKKLVAALETAYENWDGWQENALNAEDRFNEMENIANKLLKMLDGAGMKALVRAYRDRVKDAREKQPQHYAKLRDLIVRAAGQLDCVVQLSGNEAGKYADSAESYLDEAAAMLAIPREDKLKTSVREAIDDLADDQFAGFRAWAQSEGNPNAEWSLTRSFAAKLFAEYESEDELATELATERILHQQTISKLEDLADAVTQFVLNSDIRLRGGMSKSQKTAYQGLLAALRKTPKIQKLREDALDPEAAEEMNVEIHVTSGMIELLVDGKVDTNFGYGVTLEQIRERLDAISGSKR